MKTSKDRVKVYELARKYEMPSKKCLFYLTESGLLGIKSHMSSLTLEEVAYFERWWEQEKSRYIKETKESKIKLKKKAKTPKTKTKTETKKKEKKQTAIKKKEKSVNIKAEKKKDKKITAVSKKQDKQPISPPKPKTEQTIQKEIEPPETKQIEKQNQTIQVEAPQKKKKYKTVSLPKPEELAKAHYTLPIEKETKEKPVTEIEEETEQDQSTIIEKGKEEIEKEEEISETSVELSKQKTPEKEIEPEIETQGVSKKRKKKRIKIDKQAIESSMRRTLASMHGGDKTRHKKKRKIKEGTKQEVEQEPKRKQVKIRNYLTAANFSALIKVKTEHVLTKLHDMGLSASLNQPLDLDTLVMLGDEFEVDVIIEKAKKEKLKTGKLESRPPVVTVMGHVDHGKTSILDYIRKTNIVAGEAGGITQHIGAYTIDVDKNHSITFIDTPGHEAFTAMRARGAQVTDIVVLVIAANERVMPQTIEAINHAQAAGVTIIVAINKCDLPEANPAKIKAELTQHGIIVEELGGDVVSIEVSAKTGSGIKELMDNIVLVAEMLELKANKNVPAKGTVLEARMDKGIGIVITLLVTEGVLKVGQHYVVGIFDGTVRLMLDDKGKRIKQAEASTPITIMGVTGMPKVGDILRVIAQKREAQHIAQQRQMEAKKLELTVVEDSITMENIYDKLLEDEKVKFKIILKADVQGSIEAIVDSIYRINKENKVQIIHKAVGPIVETDILLASSSGAIIIGYNIRPSGKIKKLATKEKVDIKLYRIIYELLEDIEDVLSGKFETKEREEVHGRAEVRMLFKIAKTGTVAGSFVIDGKILRNDNIRLIRDAKVIYEGKIRSLKHFKNDVAEVTKGYECGIGIENFNDIKEGDVLESFGIISETQAEN